MSFGKYLGVAREKLHLSYSNVTALSNGELSQNYLAQLEEDRIKQPSVRKLHMLSVIYDIPYYELLALAGYISAGKAVETEKGILKSIIDEQPHLRDALEALIASMPPNLRAADRYRTFLDFAFAGRYFRVSRRSQAV